MTKFNNLRKATNDTYILCALKLEDLMRQYLEARKAKKFETLVSLFISDRIKSSLSESVEVWDESMMLNQLQQIISVHQK